MALTTVNSSGVKDDSIVNADIKSDAAIAGTKIDPDFGSQQIDTTGNIVCTNGQIQSFGGQNGLYIKRTVSGTSSGYSLFGNNSRTWALEYNSNQFSINDHTAVNVPRIGIDENGYVGIGTADPDRKFHILDAGSAYLRLTNASTSISNGTITGMIEFEHKDSSGAGVAAAIRSEIKDTDTGSATLNFSTGTPSGLGTRMTILPDGKVGIGTEAPTGKVTIKNADDANINVLEVKNDNDNVSGGFSQSSAGDGTLFSQRNDGTLSIFFRSNGISYLNGGNVGIGTTSPATALHVNGEISVPFNNTIRWLQSDGTVSVDMYANSGDSLIIRNDSGGQISTLTKTGDLTIPGNLYLDADSKYLYTGDDQDAYYGHNGDSLQFVNTKGWIFIGNSGASNDAPIYIRTHHSYNQITLFSTSHSSRPGEVALCAGATGTERLTTTSEGIYVNGNVKIPNTYGINFSAYATAASGSGSPDPSSNLLDDYEVGTWTPGISEGTAGHADNKYIKIGKIVHFFGRVHNPTDISSSNMFTVTGLPFAVAVSGTAGSCFGKEVNATGATTVYVSTAEHIYFYGHNAGNAWNYIKYNDLATSGCEIYYSGTYHTT